MSAFKLLDVVKTLQDLPAVGIAAGTVGAIVDVHRHPDLAYDVEFCDAQGQTVAMLPLKGNEIALAAPTTAAA